MNAYIGTQISLLCNKIASSQKLICDPTTIFYFNEILNKNFKNVIYDTKLKLIASEITANYINAKTHLILEIITQILISAIEIIVKEKYQTILPWDIENVINKHKPLTVIFILTQIESHPISHSLELISGIIIFLQILKRKFILNMFNINLDIKPITSRYTSSTISKYTLKYNNITYFFNTHDFIQGFQIASIWTSINTDPYFKNIRHNKLTPSGYQTHQITYKDIH